MDRVLDIEAARAINVLRKTLVSLPDGGLYVEDTYTQRVRALLMTALRRIVDEWDDRAQDVFNRVLDGADVADALADARRQWVADEFGDALTFEPVADRVHMYTATDNERRYVASSVGSNHGACWNLTATDLEDADDTETLHGLPDRWTAELVARALNAYDYANNTRTGLLPARDRVLAAIECNKCHGCARDAHGKGHVPKCPQATDSGDRAGHIAQDVQA